MNYVGPRAGAGKTYAYACIATNRSKTKRNTVIISPTLNLINETEATIRAMDPNCRILKIHSDDEQGSSVIQRVVTYLEGGMSTGDILLISQQCFLSLPYFKGKSNWKLLVDEDIPVFTSITLNLHESHNLITDHIGSGESGSTFARVELKNKTALKRILDNKNGDEIWRSNYPRGGLVGG